MTLLVGVVASNKLTEAFDAKFNVLGIVLLPVVDVQVVPTKDMLCSPEVLRILLRCCSWRDKAGFWELEQGIVHCGDDLGQDKQLFLEDTTGLFTTFAEFLSLPLGSESLFRNKQDRFFESVPDR